MPDFDPVSILKTLVDQRVEFVLVGGVAARLRGAPLLTQDVDITPNPEDDNLYRLASALRQLEARLRTAKEPEGVPFPFDPELLKSSAIWTMTTRHGDLDLVMMPAGTSGYHDIVRDSDVIRIAVSPRVDVKVASLNDVIRSKQAAARPKDLAALPLLRQTLNEIDLKREGSEGEQ